MSHILKSDYHSVIENKCLILWYNMVLFKNKYEQCSQPIEECLLCIHEALHLLSAHRKRYNNINDFFYSVAVIKYPDKKQLWGEIIHFLLTPKEIQSN